MKKTVFLALILSMTINCLAQETKSPLEGAWKLVYGKWGAAEFPGNMSTFNQTKVWLKDYVTFSGEYRLGTSNVLTKNYGVSTYRIIGNGYEQTGICGNAQGFTGKITKVLFEIKNDTLIQRWPADDNWKLIEKFEIEKYVRLK